MSQISPSTSSTSPGSGSGESALSDSTAATSISETNPFKEIAATWSEWEKKINAASPPHPEDLLNDKEDLATQERRWKEFGDLTDTAIKDVVEAFEQWQKENEEIINAWQESLNLPTDFDDSIILADSWLFPLHIQQPSNEGHYLTAWSPLGSTDNERGLKASLAPFFHKTYSDQFTTLSYFLSILKSDPVQITNFFSGSMLEFDFLSTILTFQLSSPLPRTQICEGFVLTVLGKAAGSGTVHLFQTTGKDIPIHSFAIVHAAAAEETVTLIDLSFKALAVLPKTVYSTAFVAGGIVKIEHALPSLPHATPVLVWFPDRPPHIYPEKQYNATRYGTSDRKRPFIHPISHTLEEKLLRTPCPRYPNLQRTQILTIQRAHRVGYSKANCGFPRFPE
ncbi:hypothetical protein C8J57DRAFT_1462079 [Mycena rebaudengoi]|nr:hypothetical protein C8J57DRAFT_1462079 [Mycena rebaudengoi]